MAAIRRAAVSDDGMAAYSSDTATLDLNFRSKFVQLQSKDLLMPCKWWHACAAPQGRSLYLQADAGCATLDHEDAHTMATMRSLSLKLTRTCKMETAAAGG